MAKLTIPQALALAVQYYQAGNLPQTEQICRAILQADPHQVEALHLLGVLAHQRGQLDQAESLISQAVYLKPDYAAAHFDLGVLQQVQGQFTQAQASFQQVLHLRPNIAEAYFNLGAVLQTQGKLLEARASYQQAIQCKPDYAEAHANLGLVLHAQGQLAEARASLEKALQLQPNFAEVYNNLGIVLYELGQPQEAWACFQQALGLKPDYAEALNNLGIALRRQRKLADAANCFQQALRLQPDFVQAHINLGEVLQTRGQLEKAIACFQQVISFKPNHVPAHSSLLHALHYRAAVTLQEVAEAHAEFEHRHAAPLRATWQPHTNNRDPDRPLRLGFLSPDLGRHPVGYFLLRVVENLDPRQAAVLCYSNRERNDDLTARFRARAEAWYEVARWNDQQVADQIRANHIDVLFDLAGHTEKNRLLVFARKPAPLQVTWLGGEGTTGLAAMDYLLADRYLVPAEAEPFYREHVLRLPDGYICYEPPSFAPPVGPLPAHVPGVVTFASFNNPAKLNDEVVAVWAQVLTRLPQARLVLKYEGLEDPAVSRCLIERFIAQGVASHRVECRGWSAHAEMLAEYGGIDLALDPFPFNGGVTTCEALWMGVPVITWPGATFASRHSLSHLSNVGLTETIARDQQDYV